MNVQLKIPKNEGFMGWYFEVLLHLRLS